MVAAQLPLLSRDHRERLYRETEMRRIFAQSRKELTQIIRDWRTLALPLVLPLVLLLLMSTAISLTASHLPTIAQALDNPPPSHDLIDPFPPPITLLLVPSPPTNPPHLPATSH